MSLRNDCHASGDDWQEGEADYASPFCRRILMETVRIQTMILERADRLRLISQRSVYDVNHAVFSF